MSATATKPEKTGVGKTFKFFTGKLSAFTRDASDGSGKQEKVIRGIASSNSRDRYGDTMTAQCQVSLLEQSKKLTMFGNHGTGEGFGRSYRVPEDVYGYCGTSSLETDGDIMKLAIEMVVAQTNERAVKSWDLINKDGVTLAFSIGGIITEAEIDEENDDGASWWPPLLINDMELLEISLVGIPANPDSYTRSFLEDIKKSAFKGATRDPGVQKAFLRSIGVKGVGEEFADLRDVKPVLLAASGVLLSKDGADGSKLGVKCKHEPACDTFNAHTEKAKGDTEKLFPFDLTKVFQDGVEGKEVLASLTAGDGLRLTKTKDSAGADVEVLAVVPTERWTLELSAGLSDEAKANLQKSVDSAKAQAQTAIDAANADVDKATKALSDINAEIQTKTAEKAKLDTALAELQQKVKTLEATPTGRKTQPTAGGSSPTLTARDLAKMTDAELREFARKAYANGDDPDARTFGDAQ